MAAMGHLANIMGFTGRFPGSHCAISSRDHPLIVRVLGQRTDIGEASVLIIIMLLKLSHPQHGLKERAYIP